MRRFSRVAMFDGAPVANELIDRPAHATYYPAFDGLRGIAILMVFLDHYGGMVGLSGFFFWGFTGVDLFFVLSGFLITGILFRTRDSPSYFKSFYWRRTLRIFPLYYAFWVALAASAWMTKPVMRWQTWLYTVYLGNWVPFNAINRTGQIVLARGHGCSWVNVSHFWSLCVEEQFYLTWPLVIWVCRGRGRRTLMWLAGSVALLVLALRVYLQMDLSAAALGPTRLYVSTYSRMDTLLLGSFMSLWLSQGTVTRGRLRKVAGVLILVPLVTLVVSMATWGRRWPVNAGHPLLATYGFTLIALVCCGVVLLAVENRMVWTRALRWKPLAGLGVISYGFYLIHVVPLYGWFLLSVRMRARGLQWLFPVVVFGVTYGMARVSYRFLEMPFLRMKSWVRPGEGEAGRAAGDRGAVGLAVEG